MFSVLVAYVVAISLLFLSAIAFCACNTLLMLRIEVVPAPLVIVNVALAPVISLI